VIVLAPMFERAVEYSIHSDADGIGGVMKCHGQLQFLRSRSECAYRYRIRISILDGVNPHALAGGSAWCPGAAARELEFTCTRRPGTFRARPFAAQVRVHPCGLQILA
jgi:hypothetical protein